MLLRRAVFVVAVAALSIACTLLVSTSDLSGSAVAADDGNTSLSDGGPGSPSSDAGVDANAPISPDGGSVIAEGGCPPSGTLFCDDFDEPTSPSTQWTKVQPAKDGGYFIDVFDFVSAPQSMVFFAPPTDFEPTATLSMAIENPAAKRARLSFDVKVDQHSPGGVLCAIGPSPYPQGLVSSYFISIRIDDNQFAYNANGQLLVDGGAEDKLYKLIGGDPSKWTHFDLDYDVTTARIDVLMNGVLKITDQLPIVPATGLSFDVGLVELQTSPNAWLAKFDNVSLSPL